jgi:4-amino-4-deoxy-L-arabinose transferase-like glycosyltransferase
MKIQDYSLTKSILAPLKLVLPTFPPAWLPVGVGLALLSALLLPLNLLATLPFHHDEALYATWALEIASGTDPWLEQVPIDKPPLFLYTVAGALWLLGTSTTVARLPSLLATVANVGLTFWLGRRLYGAGVGLLAAWLVALSPFTILFAPTAFTDPLLVALALAASVAAASGRPGWSGLWLGLAIATKQQGIIFALLLLALLGAAIYTSGSAFHRPRSTRFALRFTLGLIIILLPLFLWDFVRHQSPGIWQLSLVNYGGLTSNAATFAERWWGFMRLLQFGTASPVLNVLFVAGLPLLLVGGLWSPMIKTGGTVADWILALFSLAFLTGHAWLSFQVWDRYLLGLIPFLALLLARILLLPWSVLKMLRLDYRPDLLSWARPVAGVGLMVLLVLTLARPVQDAVNARYPLGSHSQALQGIEQIVAYLQGQVGANHTLYHRWLGPHWRFYLWGYPYDLQYWASPSELAAKARPGHLIAFPGWQSDTEARLALAEAGFGLQELARGYTPAGNPSIILYQITR